MQLLYPKVGRRSRVFDSSTATKTFTPKYQVPKLQFTVWISCEQKLLHEALKNVHSTNKSMETFEVPQRLDDLQTLELALTFCLTVYITINRQIMLEFDCSRILHQGEVYISHQNDWHAQEIHPFSFFMVMWSAVIDKTKEESGEAKTARRGRKGSSSQQAY
jgi:hypothetical protein